MAAPEFYMELEPGNIWGHNTDYLSTTYKPNTSRHSKPFGISSKTGMFNQVADKEHSRWIFSVKHSGIFDKDTLLMIHNNLFSTLFFQ